MKGVVTKSTGNWYQVLENDTKIFYEARIRGKFKLLKTRLTNPLAVGDSVQFELEKDDVAWITHIEPRKNYLIRKSVNLSKEAHMIAANIDLACILFTLKKPETSLGFLDRFLATCQAYDIQPLILFNKVDILSEEEKDLLRSLEHIYQSIGYNCLEISSYSKLNLDRLQSMLKDRISVVFGHSGSGKSTLVNALNPGLDLKTTEISESHSKGKHTTTFAQMHFWSFGGAVIDTPGVREFGVIDMNEDEIQHYFPEIFTQKSNCKFHNCKHLNEPKCAVLEALNKSEIQRSRYETYLKLMEEVSSNNT